MNISKTTFSDSWFQLIDNIAQFVSDFIVLILSLFAENTAIATPNYYYYIKFCHQKMSCFLVSKFMFLAAFLLHPPTTSKYHVQSIVPHSFYLNDINHHLPFYFISPRVQYTSAVLLPTPINNHEPLSIGNHYTLPNGRHLPYLIGSVICQSQSPTLLDFCVG